MSLFYWLFLCYPLVSQIVFSIFVCRTIDGTSYLEADYTLTCDTPAYRAALGWSVVWFIVYVCGFPLGLLYALSQEKQWIKFVEENYRVAADVGGAKRVQWRSSYWLVCIAVKRLFLSSVLLFFRRGGATRIALAVLVTMTSSTAVAARWQK